MGHSSTAVNNNFDAAYLLKINVNGIQQWNRDFASLLGTPFSSYANYVSLTSDGGYILTGNNNLAYLVKTDSLGHISTTGIVSENATENNLSVLIYPNPLCSKTTLQTNKILKDATLTMYNFHGQQVKQITNISGQTIILNRDNLSSGLYFIRLTQDNKVIKSDKLVITD